MTTEVHRPVLLDRIGPHASEFTVEANEAELQSVAQRLRIPAVLALRCRFRIFDAGAGTLEATGHLEARVVQICVVTLDAFDASVDETFAVRFVPAGTESDSGDPELEDEVPYAGGVLDLGEAAVEQLALSLDPYPRKPGASLPELPGIETNPAWAQLAALKRPN